MSEAASTASVPTKPSKHKLLSEARQKLLAEFTLKPEVLKDLDNQLGQEPYNMVRGRPSTRWSKNIEQIWTWNCAKPDKKGRKHYDDKLEHGGETFSRRKLMSQPVFSADLTTCLRKQFREELGYDRVYTKFIKRTDYNTGKEYETMLVQVPVYA